MEQLSWKHKLRMEMIGVFIKLNIHHLASIDMEYLNQFHKESEERKIKQIAEWRKSPVDLRKRCRGSETGSSKSKRWRQRINMKLLYES